MLNEQPGKVAVIFSVGFDAQIDYGLKLPEIGKSVNRYFDEKLWISSPSNYTFRDLKKRVFFCAQHNTFFFQAMGWNHWTNFLPVASEVIDSILSIYRLETVERLSLRTISLLNLKMTHAEMVDQMFGTYLADKSKFSGIVDSPDDNVAAIYGAKGPNKIRLQIMPQTPEQVKISFLQIPNLETFVENRLIDDTVRDVWHSISGNTAINVDADIWSEKVSAATIKPFLTNGTATMEKIVADAIKHLLDSPF